MKEEDRVVLVNSFIEQVKFINSEKKKYDELISKYSNLKDLVGLYFSGRNFLESNNDQYTDLFGQMVCDNCGEKCEHDIVAITNCYNVMESGHIPQYHGYSVSYPVHYVKYYEYYCLDCKQIMNISCKQKKDFEKGKIIIDMKERGYKIFNLLRDDYLKLLIDNNIDDTIKKLVKK